MNHPKLLLGRLRPPCHCQARASATIRGTVSWGKPKERHQGLIQQGWALLEVTTQSLEWTEAGPGFAAQEATMVGASTSETAKGSGLHASTCARSSPAAHFRVGRLAALRLPVAELPRALQAATGRWEKRLWTIARPWKIRAHDIAG